MPERSREELISEINDLKEETERLREIVSLSEEIEDRLFESREKYHNLLKVVPDTIYNITPEGYFTYISESIKYLGYEPKELIGKHFSTIIHPDDIHKISRNFVLPHIEGNITGPHKAPKLFDERRTGHRITRNLEIRVIPKDWARLKNKDNFMIGSVFACGEVCAGGNYEKDSEKKINFLGTVGVIRDITDRKRVSDEIQKIQKLESIGLLAGGIAHDFNNVLTAILGSIILSKMELPEDSPVLESLKDAESACHRAKKLTEQLLCFAKGGAPVTHPSSVRELLEDTAKFSLKGSSINCLFEIPDDTGEVDIDESQISQVINNILINAKQAMPHGGEIQISAENIDLQPVHPSIIYGNFVRISIKDNGPGIPHEIQSRIFEPYFTTKKEGSGLGLATSYAIVKRHNGYLTVDSEPGNGTLFSIYLKASDGFTSPETRKKSKIDRRILVMEVTEASQAFLGDLLTNLGYDITLASTFDEAEEILTKANEKNRLLSLLLLDCSPFSIDESTSSLKKLKKLTPSLKIAPIIPMEQRNSADKYKEAGATAVITRPFRLEDLTKTVSELTDF